MLPKARRNLTAAAVLGFGRAVGDTLIPLMLAGNATQVPGGLTESLRTLTAHMALVNGGVSLALRRLETDARRGKEMRSC